MNALLEARNVVKVFTTTREGKTQKIQAVRNVSINIHPGEIVGLVGESGCGKSTISRIMIGIEPSTSGSVIYEGKEVRTRADWKALRRHVQYVFQDPFTALCPTMRIGDALAEPLIIHRIGIPRERVDRVAHMLEMVGLHPDMARRMPSQLSGGQRQRVNLARALMLEPKILICDEIVSGLDVSVQAQVLQLLIDLQEKLDLSLMFISHDLRVVHYLSSRVLVMYLGEIVEQGPTKVVFDNPEDAYTRSLLAAIPDHSRRSAANT
ncbi:ATP-binding cassette domain-containing protein [Hoeflea sp. G2-23]|uniref:ATP-binding cassette domain-containing protein n=1 Tax=Hoeflea algicola TaxID=2983763 RepID=A0ABT3ZEH8_9HYPH|nr:ATP-binding cassette domain-containing protein [Hoeflea algicola]MCY0150163.1 ATP-binding cassette domain-containing protein [Hoeflea algicola]